MIVRIIIFLCLYLINPVKAQDSIPYDFYGKYKYIYNLMPLTNIDTLFKHARELEDSAHYYNDKIGIGHSLAMYGLINYIMISDHIKAYNYFIQALKIYESVNYADGISSLKIQLGLINYSLKNSDQAIEDFKDAYNNAMSIDKQLRAAVAIYLTAHTLIDLDRIDEARSKLELAENIYKEFDDEEGLAECLMTFGIIYLKQGQYDSAISNLESFCEKASDSPYGIALATPYLARAYFHKNQLNKARSLAEYTLNLSREIKKANWELNALEVYRDILYVMGDYKTAAKIAIEYTRLNDSIFNSNRLYKTAVMKFDYDNEKKQMEDVMKLAQIEARQEANLNRQKLLTNVFLITSIIVLILVLGIFHQYKLKNAKNKELALTMIDLKKTQDQLVLKEKLASLGQLTAGIAHEIQNPLNFVNNFAQVSLEMAEEAEQVTNLEEAKEYISDIKGNLTKVNFHGNRVSSIIKSMLQHSRFSKQEKALTDINKFVEDFINIAITGRKAGNLTLHFDVKYDLYEDIPEIEIVQQDLGRVLVNIFNNAFDAVMERSTVENGTYEPAIHISTGIKNNYIYIDVKDNGKGIPEELKQKIFEPFFTTKKAGAGTGLGLSITNEILTANGGMLQVDSTAHVGSTFRILLPLS
jgi:two-component system, NtrC family, sensor kinase